METLALALAWRRRLRASWRLVLPWGRITRHPAIGHHMDDTGERIVIADRRCGAEPRMWPLVCRGLVRSMFYRRRLGIGGHPRVVRLGGRSRVYTIDSSSLVGEDTVSAIS
jgi:hypothetical protein